jgi:tetratricopeptide (TPR) repeat protein
VTARAAHHHGTVSSLPGPCRLAFLLATGAAALASACAGTPPHPRALEQVRRGYAHLAAGDRERAEVAFEHALEIAPGLAEASAGLGVVLRAGGRPDLALPRLDAAIFADPDLAEAHAARGEALIALGRTEAGMDSIADALAVDPDQVAARIVRARRLTRALSTADGAARVSLLERARRDLLHALEAAPDLALVHHDLGWVEWLRGDFRASAAAYGRAARLDPARPESHLGECAALLAAGDLPGANAACARCREAAPGDPLVAARCGLLAPRDPG